MRDLLRKFLEECPTCMRCFLDNASIFLDAECGVISNDDAGQILILLSDFHLSHAEES